MNKQSSRTHSAVGDLLRRYREIAGLSQEALAELAGLSPRGLLYLERGLRRPYPDTLRRLADALGLSAQEREALALAGRQGVAAPAAVPHPPDSPADGSISAPIGSVPVASGNGPPVPGAGPAAGMAAPAPAEPLHNLPAALSSFIGREQAQARVCDLLSAHRLVTLTGPGGVGKTRLALAVAEGMLDLYPDGVRLVELAALSDPALVPEAVAAALGLREESGRAMIQTVRDYCRDKRLLLLLDNCEHLLAACTALAGALLRAAPALRILTTSREALGIAGERRYRVPSLSVPDPAHLPSPELAGSYEAVRLFVARAQERRDSFVLTERNARAVAEVCARLDGLPLAIELAAARVASLSVQTIAAHLDDRFRLLSTGSADLPTRQRTLRAALDWSWDLLHARERTLLSRLSVFAGGCTLQAATAVCAGQREQEDQKARPGQLTHALDGHASEETHGQTGEGVTGRAGQAPDGPGQQAGQLPNGLDHRAGLALDYWAVVDGLDALVNRSLAQADETPDGANRYRLLESVRQHAGEQLAAAGEDTATRDDHLTYFLNQAEQAVRAFRGAEMGVWIDRLEQDHDNLRAALSWARLAEKGEEALQLAAALAPFWEFRGYLAEGRRRMEEVLAAFQGSPAARARALNAAGFLAMRAGDYRASLDLYAESLALRRALGDQQGMAVALNNIGNAYIEMGEYAPAEPAYAEALEYYRALGDHWGVSAALNNLSVAVRELGQYERAESLANESLALRRAQDDPRGVAEATNNLALMVFAQGRYTEATALFKEGLVLSREVGDKLRLLEALEGLTWAAAALGPPRRAARLGAAGEAERERLDMPLGAPERAYHDRAVLSMRAALGDEALTAAWAEGRHVTLSEAIALALPPDPAG